MAGVMTASMVTLQVSSNVTSMTTENRFGKAMTIAGIKGKLELITGCSASNAELKLFDKDGNLVGVMDNNDAMLGSYPVDDNMRIHVVDNTPGAKIGEFEDFSKVEKFEISKEEYEQRTDSVKAFKMRNKMGRFREVTPEEEEQKKEKERLEQEAAQAIPVGSRCEVRIAGAPSKRGEVMFVGQTDFKPGWWIGIKYDEPLGKNDGSVGGKQYFQCIPKYGGFVKPKDVVVGDFPEDDLGIGDDEEM